jgi:hypothetical protein
MHAAFTSVGTIADAARMSACATRLLNDPVKKNRRQISFPGIRQDYHDGFTGEFGVTR